MTLIKIIILIAISYCCCCCSLISCASGGNHESEVGSSTSGNADGNSEHAELDELGNKLFMSRDDFDRERPRLLETSEVVPLLNRFADLQARSIGTQAAGDDQAQNRWTNPASKFLVGALQEFISLAEEDNVEKILKNCESMLTMQNVQGTRTLVTAGIPILSKFVEENYQRIIGKCADLLESRFEVFSAMIGDELRAQGRDFAELINLSMSKLKLFGSDEDEVMKRLAFTEAAARFVETFGGPGTMRRDIYSDAPAFRKHFMDRTRIKLDVICEKFRQVPLNIVYDIINVLLEIEPAKLASMDGFYEYKDWMSVAGACQLWQLKISRTKVFNAHVSFHMDLRGLTEMKRLYDSLFSSSARSITDTNEIESRLKDLRNVLEISGIDQNEMFILNVKELNVLLDIKNRNSESGDLMQQIEPFIRYYESIEAHNIVFYLNSLIHAQTGNSLREMETILRVGNEQLANYPQINENLRELRRFLPGSNNIGAELTTSVLLTGLTDYFLSNLRNFERMSQVKDHQSRKDLVTHWFIQFMNANCEKYKDTFDNTLLAQRNLRPEKALSGLDDELKLVLFNVILCNNMDNNILNHIDELTGLISSRLDGGGPSDQIDEMTQIGL